MIRFRLKNDDICDRRKINNILVEKNNWQYVDILPPELEVFKVILEIEEISNKIDVEKIPNNIQELEDKSKTYRQLTRKELIEKLKKLDSNITNLDKLKKEELVLMLCQYKEEV